MECKLTLSPKKMTWTKFPFVFVCFFGGGGGGEKGWGDKERTKEKGGKKEGEKTSSIAIITAVERLVNISNKVNHKRKRGWFPYSLKKKKKKKKKKIKKKGLKKKKHNKPNNTPIKTFQSLSFQIFLNNFQRTLLLDGLVLVLFAHLLGKVHDGGSNTTITHIVNGNTIVFEFVKFLLLLDVDEVKA